MTTFAGHTGPISAVELTPDGGRLVTASLDATVRVWDTATGRAIAVLSGHRRSVLAVAMNGNRRVLSGSSDGTARIWDVVPRGFAGSLPTAGLPSVAAWFAGRDRVMAVGENGELVAFLSQASGWDSLGPRVPPHAPGLVALSADGDRYAMANDREVEVWDTVRRSRLATLSLPGRAAGILLSRDGRWFVAFGEGAGVWDAATGSLRVALPAVGSPAIDGDLSPAGDRLVLAHEDGSVSSWDVRTGLRLPDSPGTIGEVASVRYDPTGTWVALGGSDARVQIIDASGGRLRRTLGRHGAPVPLVRFSPDAALLYSLGSDRIVRVWELASGSELAAIAVDGFGGLDVSPDGTRLLVRQELGR